MRAWKGINDGESDVGGDGLGNASRGVSFYVEGELRRRPGMTYLASHGGIALGTFAAPLTGQWLVVVKSNGDIESVAL